MRRLKPESPPLASYNTAEQAAPPGAPSAAAPVSSSNPSRGDRDDKLNTEMRWNSFHSLFNLGKILFHLVSGGMTSRLVALSCPRQRVAFAGCIQSSPSPLHDTSYYQTAKSLLKCGQTRTNKAGSKCGNLPLHSELSSTTQRANEQFCGF